MADQAPSGRLRDAAISAACRCLALPFRLRHSSRVQDEPGRVVVVKTGSIGDVLMATPVLRAVRQAVPRVALAFAVGAWSKPMVASNWRLNEVVDLGPLGGRKARLSDYWAAVRRLRAGRYDAALVLDRAPLITLLPYLAGIPLRIGLDSDGRGFSLTRRVPCREGVHEIDLYLQVAEAAGWPAAGRQTEFMPTAADRAVVARLLAEHGCFATPRSPLIAIHPGGGVNPGTTLLAKRWPAARFAGVANRLTRDQASTVVLVGGPDDRPVAAEVRTGLHDQPIDLSGALSWGELGALLERCQLLLANDTGAAHLGVAVGTRVVVVFGPTDPGQYGPPEDAGEAVAATLPCRPCFRRGRLPPCRNQRRCLAALDEHAVWHAVMRQWTAEPPARPAQMGQEG